MPAAQPITASPKVMSSPSGYTTEILRTMEEVLALRETWQRFALEPITDIDLYREVVQGRSEVLRPHVVVLKRGGEVQTILAGRIEMKALEVGIGYAKIALPRARFLVIHTGLLGDTSEGNASLLLDSVLTSLREREADVAWFHGMDARSTFYQAARRAGGLFTRDHFPQLIPRWRLQLARTYDEFFRGLSSNTRHNLRRYSKRLRDRFGEEIGVKTFRSASDLEWILRDTEIVASKTYHRGLGAGFVLNDETRRLMTLAASRGWLRAYILYIADKPSAFWNGFLYGRTFFPVTTGYDPELVEFRPGMFLLQRMLEDICRDGSAGKVDFGFGDAQYKRDLCDSRRLDGSFLLFAPSFQGVALSLMRTPLVFATRLARSALSRVRVLQEIKRAWRGRLAGRGQRVQSAAPPVGGGAHEAGSRRSLPQTAISRQTRSGG